MRARETRIRIDDINVEETNKDQSPNDNSGNYNSEVQLYVQDFIKVVNTETELIALCKKD